ncbi:MAG: FAD:protein FMN transferase ApbE, partial [Candidatus Hydrogenedentes bacterium]|nr:FAD:protein FMN transferase ApbE [Candidatus Hydrogenedentota bacterium]
MILILPMLASLTSPWFRRATAAFSLLLISGCSPQSPVPQPAGPSIVVEGPTMGTHFTVKLRHDDPGVCDRAAERVPAILNAIDAMMSTYKPDSELSRFNRFQSTDPFKVSPEMVEIFQLAREVGDATGGAFDITVGPIVNAWGFGPEKRVTPPTNAEIAALLPRVGYKMVTIDAAASTLRKERPDIYCDLSGIAQG